jgi:hypothetical protein
LLCSRCSSGAFVVLPLVPEAVEGSNECAVLIKEVCELLLVFLWFGGGAFRLYCVQSAASAPTLGEKACCISAGCTLERLEIYCAVERVPEDGLVLADLTRQYR